MMDNNIGTQFDAIVTQIAKCLATAPDKELDVLNDMISRYVDRFPETWRGIRNQPAARKLLDAICAEAAMQPHGEEYK